MDDRRGGQTSQAAQDSPRHGRSARRWHWQMILAALLALLAVQGQPVAASYATTGAVGRAAEVARRQAHDTTVAGASREADIIVRDGSADGRPDFQVTFTTLDDAQVGQPFSYTIRVRNDGSAAGVASVNAIVPPELSNVRVNAPGFVCTRRFTPSGAQAGTLVACMRNDLEGGAVADVTIEANAPSTAGTYQLTAVADPRDEVAEADEGNNAADVTVSIRGELAASGR